ncbi:variable surface protein [Plasmodium gonderi]|uniref:Variable surface protein n=1 Tax=Plasmodium gonderi TaxID=77519 RepID=A0A1Y1JCU9_PLAGO|nr:variable surface protein [Plasmodium gonderi]GAW79027.1 variable surface protein [Plasmodium gonderi]
MALLPENKWEEKLPDLPSYKEYKKFDVDTADYNNDFCAKLEGNTSDKTLCNKIAKNLSILKSENDKKKQKERCHYFQHWFQDQISLKYYERKDTHNDNPVAGKLFDLVSDAILNHNIDQGCRGNFFGRASTWKEDKDLHDYFYNFEYIQKNKSNKKDCKNYVDYVTYIDKLYIPKEEDCCDEDYMYDQYCAPYIKCGHKYNTETLLDELKTELASLRNKEDQVNEDIVSLPEEVTSISSSKEETQYGASEEESDISHLERYAAPTDSTDNISSIERMYNHLDANHFYNIIITTSVLGTILFLFYYHRSSRLGSSERKSKKKKNKKENNYYNNFDEDLGMYDSEVTYLNSQTCRFYVTYDQAKNPYY